MLILSFSLSSFGAAYHSSSIVSKLDSRKHYFDDAYLGISAGVLYICGDVKNTIIDKETELDNGVIDNDEVSHADDVIDLSKGVFTLDLTFHFGE